MGNRRGMYEISADILKVARSGAKKSHLVYRANLNFEVIKEYLRRLERDGLIENSGRIFRTTEKGVEFLHRFKALREYMTS